MAFGYLDLTPEQFWNMTPRQFYNKQQGFYEKNAYLAILNRKAMNEKRVSMDSLLGRNKQVSNKKVVSIDEHRNMIAELENRFKK
jgi:acyl-ACP thioesterase